CECVRRLRIRRQPVSRLFPYTTLFRSVRDEASERRLRVIDATCPLVTKVHAEARRFAKNGYTIVLVGHDGHEEVEGTTGEAPDSIRLIGSAEEVDALDLNGGPVAYLTQTTLAVDEVDDVV